jgi:hypothetical protein
MSTVATITSVDAGAFVFMRIWHLDANSVYITLTDTGVLQKITGSNLTWVFDPVKYTTGAVLGNIPLLAHLNLQGGSNTHIVLSFGT